MVQCCQLKQLLQAMTYDGDGNLAYELDYNPDALVDGRNIYLPAHGNRAERNLYEKVEDFHGWVRGDYTLTEYLNDVTKENVEVLAEYGKNYCSATIYTYGNELVSATTFNGYGYHFGCHHNGYHDIYNQYEKWHDRWHIKDRYHNSNDKFNNGSHNRPRTVEDGVATTAFVGIGYDFFRAVYGSYSNYHSGRYCGHSWKTAMSKIYYLYDGHGSVERMHGKDGSTFRLEYDTYGNLVAGLVEEWHVWHNDIFAHRTMNLYAYSCERYNVVSGLQYLRARWYDTDTGRFISEDSYLGTKAEPLSRNRYIYTHNNPVNYVDPSGHMPSFLRTYFMSAMAKACVEVCDMSGEENEKKIKAKLDEISKKLINIQTTAETVRDAITAIQYVKYQNAKERLWDLLSTKVNVTVEPSKINWLNVGLGMAEMLLGGAGFIGSIAGSGASGGTAAPAMVLTAKESIALASLGYTTVLVAVANGVSVTFSKPSNSGSGEKSHKEEAKSEEMLGEGGTQVRGSKTTGKNGSTERVDVENPAPGKRAGDVHYHDANNVKWRYDVRQGKLFNSDTGELAPPSIQKVMNEGWFKKAIVKALSILGE